MVRAPCCVKMGLKKGPWNAEEDQLLADYINKHGHGNWRALPKHAGLLRCGKSCRLRWMNYLRPDIKRGNFSQEEEETIISLHEKLGNRWSAIAARLSGRTDNEIKNVWHTHLKKRAHPSPKSKVPKKEPKKKSKSNGMPKTKTGPKPKPKPARVDDSAIIDDSSPVSAGSLMSRANSCSDFSSSSSGIESCSTYIEISDNNNISGNISGKEIEESCCCISSDQALLTTEIDESFWMEVLSLDVVDSTTSMDLSSFICSSSDGDDLEFWSNMFMEAGGLQEDFLQF